MFVLVKYAQHPETETITALKNRAIVCGVIDFLHTLEFYCTNKKNKTIKTILSTEIVFVHSRLHEPAFSFTQYMESKHTSQMSQDMTGRQDTIFRLVWENGRHG